MAKLVNPMQLKYHEFVINDRDIEFLRQNRKHMVDLSVDTELLKAAAKLCAGQPNPARLQKICADERRARALGILLRLFRVLLDLPGKLRRPERVREDLKQVKYPEGWVDAVVEMAFDAGFIEAVEGTKRIEARDDAMSEVSWKIDVNICTSKIGKILEPTITLSFRKGDSTHSFEVPLSKFHHLRFCVADLLKEMSQLENHPAVKLDA